MSSRAEPFEKINDRQKKALAGFLDRYCNDHPKMLAPRFLMTLLNSPSGEFKIFCEANSNSSANYFQMPISCGRMLEEASQNKFGRRTALKYGAILTCMGAGAVIASTGPVKYISKHIVPKNQREPQIVTPTDQMAPYAGVGAGILIASIIALGTTITLDNKNDKDDRYARLDSVMKKMEPFVQQALANRRKSTSSEMSLS